MEAICSAKTSVDFQRTTRCYIPEDGTLNKYLFITKLVTNNYLKIIRFAVTINYYSIKP
jgi:hypothetical protein